MTNANDVADKGGAPLGEQKTFCRSVDADPRKQGKSGGSVLAHMTNAKDAADEGGAQQNEPKNFLPFSGCRSEEARKERRECGK